MKQQSADCYVLPMMGETFDDDAKQDAVLDWLSVGGRTKDLVDVARRNGVQPYGDLWRWARAFCMVEWEPGGSRWTLRRTWSRVCCKGDDVQQPRVPDAGV